MGFFGVWFSGIVNPSRAYDLLKDKKAPELGLYAVLTRFLGTSLTTILLLFLMQYKPFQPSYLTFLSTQNYYKAEIFFMPVFGLFIWLLMSGTAHLIFRLSGRSSDFDKLLNVVGFGMLVPMPVVWVWDWLMIAFNSYSLLPMAVSHFLFQLWETGVECVGVRRLQKLKAPSALGIAILINALYIGVAAIVIR